VLDLRPACPLPGGHSYTTRSDWLGRMLRGTDLPSTALEKFEKRIWSPRGANLPAVEIARKSSVRLATSETSDWGEPGEIQSRNPCARSHHLGLGYDCTRGDRACAGSSEASLGARLLGVIRIECGKIIQVLFDDPVALARPLL
jgi:hypothetical protein